MAVKLLSNKEINNGWMTKIKPHHYEIGYKPEEEMPYCYLPYFRDGEKIARAYIDGIGCQMRHAIYY